ncbi:MAG TPA: hypothetical protein VJA21_10390 [Verrucomicrobiae bacterium]
MLETTPDLSLTNSWRVLTTDIVVSGGTCFLTNSTSPPAAFYRLRQGP